MAPSKSNGPANPARRPLRVIDLTEEEDSPNLESYTAPAPAPALVQNRGHKRKIDLVDVDNDVEITGGVEGRVKRPKPAPVAEEKRLGRWRSQPTQQLRDRIHRCLTQRMVVLNRHRNMEVSPPEELFQIAGTTGNVYQVHIKRKSTCSCPDGIQTGLCKHILYVLMKVLRARDELVYQTALLSSELETIFSQAPAAPASSSANSGPSNRKPLEDDDCPICYSEFDDEESTVYCISQCGTNIHEACFRQWAATQGPGQVTCVMCRQPWHSENVKSTLVGGRIGEEGYVNVAEQLGMSLERDTSTYAPGYGVFGGYGYRRRGYW